MPKPQRQRSQAARPSTTAEWGDEERGGLSFLSKADKPSQPNKLTPTVKRMEEDPILPGGLESTPSYKDALCIVSAEELGNCQSLYSTRPLQSLSPSEY